MNITFEDFKGVCKHQDVIFANKGFNTISACYCKYDSPSIQCNEENCPVLKEKEFERVYRRRCPEGETPDLISSKSKSTIEQEGVYTTGEIATYAGVSVQTINVWIKDGRINPVTRTLGDRGQYRIPVSAKIASRNGSFILISDLVENHYKLEAKCIDLPIKKKKILF